MFCEKAIQLLKIRNMVDKVRIKGSRLEIENLRKLCMTCVVLTSFINNLIGIYIFGLLDSRNGFERITQVILKSTLKPRYLPHEISLLPNMHFCFSYVLVCKL